MLRDHVRPIPEPQPRAEPKPAAPGPVWWRELTSGRRRAPWKLRLSFAGSLIGAAGFAVVAVLAAIESFQDSGALFTLVVALLCVAVFTRAAGQRARLLRAG